MSVRVFEIKNIYDFLLNFVRSRKLIFELAKNDFKSRYIGSYLGITWAFIQPLVTIFILWFIFQIGFKSQPVENFPFVLWLTCAIIPWFFFSDCLSSATNSIIESSYLVKKIVFRVSILPMIKIISSLFVHLFFVVLLLIIFGMYGYRPSLFNLQIFYYLFATIVFVFGLSWITSSLVVFVKDVAHIVSVVLQFGFWLTPIFWSLDILPQRYIEILKLNPIYYVTEGYRNSLIYGEWFWENPVSMLYFWGITFLFWIIGAFIFNSLRPHFADVL